MSFDEIPTIPDIVAYKANTKESCDLIEKEIFDALLFLEKRRLALYRTYPRMCKKCGDEL